MEAIFLLKASELKNKEVINLSNNEKMGFISDFEICTTNGEISAIIVPNKNKFFSYGKNSQHRIPWSKISGFGDDIILVNIDSEVLF